MIAARPSGGLPDGGGEYVNLYWTTGTPDELGRDFRALGARLTEVGRMEPNQYIHTSWRTRTSPGSLQARPEQVLSAEAVVASPVNSGMLLVINDVPDGPQRDAYVRWRQTERVPMILGTGIFNGAVTVVGSDAERQNHVAELFYTDVDDPTSAYVELQKQLADWSKTGRDFPDVNQVRRKLHSSMYTNSIGQYQFYN